MESTNNHECLVSTLMKLRESSKDAVVSADYIDDFALYMHVGRPVQERFEDQLKKSAESSHAELILLCGSVGDGKSHMLQMCKHKFKDYMDRFYVHNDSTASLYIDKPATYTLNELLEDFSDEKVDKSTSKVILAINLGTLSNFLDQDVEGRFTRLSKYVQDAGILDGKTDKEKEENYFHSINFADYHLYELSENGPYSTYINQLIKKIANKSELNVFYDSYSKNCSNCEAREICPIRINYELLANNEIRNGIVSTIIESIVKNKLIISTRTLLNFIYEILVNENYFDQGSLEPRKIPDKLTQIQYINSLLPSTLFDREGSSELLTAIHKVDPLHIRNEKIDEFFVHYENDDQALSVFYQDLPAYKDVLTKIQDADFSDYANHDLKDELLHLYIRMCRLLMIKEDLLPEDKLYVEYMRFLYAWNIGNQQDLRQLYNDVEKGILSWNGAAEKNEMQLSTGNSKSGYHLYQDINLKIVPTDAYTQEESVLYSFRDELKLRYEVKGANIQSELDLDYNLYELLKRVIKGYIPNLSDKRVNVRCLDFINRISRGGSKMESLKIRNLSQKKSREYIFEYDEVFGYSFEEK